MLIKSECLLTSPSLKTFTLAFYHYINVCCRNTSSTSYFCIPTSHRHKRNGAKQLNEIKATRECKNKMYLKLSGLRY